MDENVARFEMEQAHEYIRHSAGLYATWFGFFTTTSLAAVAWSFHSSLGVDGTLTSPALVLSVIAFFAIQSFLAIHVSNIFRESLIKARDRAFLIQQQIHNATANYVPQTPMPSALIHGMLAMRLVLKVNAWILPAIGVVLLYCSCHGYRVAGPPDKEGAKVESHDQSKEH